MHYARPDSLPGALAELRRGALLVAGGTVAGPDVHRGPVPRRIVDISAIDELSGISGEDEFTVGAVTTVEMLASHAGLRRRFAALVTAAAAIGNPQIRRRATVGGNLALCGRTLTDLYAPLLALDARVRAIDPTGTPIDARLEDVTTPSWWTHKLVVELVLQQRSRSAFRRLAWRRASGRPIVNVAVPYDGGSARAFVGGLTPIPLRVDGPDDPRIAALSPSRYLARLVRVEMAGALEESWR